MPKPQNPIFLSPVRARLALRILRLMPHFQLRLVSRRGWKFWQCRAVGPGKTPEPTVGPHTESLAEHPEMPVLPLPAHLLQFNTLLRSCVETIPLRISSYFNTPMRCV